MRNKKSMRRAILIAVLAVLLALGAVFAVLAVREAPYRRLNALLEEPAKKLTLTLESDLDGDVLHAEYRMTNGEGAKDVRYSYEQLATITVEGDEIRLPPARIVTKEGSVRISGGRVVLLDGEMPNLSMEALTLSRLRFSSRCFANAVAEEGSFSADVTDPEALFGFGGGATGMHLTLTYAQQRPTALSLSYVSERGEAVRLCYEFEY